MQIWNLHVFLLELLCNFLRFFMHASSTLPLLAICALFLSRRNLQQAWLKRGTFLVDVSLFFALFGVIAVFSDPFLVYVKFCAQGMVPRVPDFFENGILPYTISALFRCLGIVPLLLAFLLIKRTQKQNISEKLTFCICLCLAFATLVFFVSYIVQMWPFGAYPKGLTFSQTCALLAQQALHQYMGAFAPAGICALFALSCKKNIHQNGMKKDSDAHEILFVRWACMWCVIGQAPGCLVLVGRVLASFMQQNILQNALFFYGQALLVLLGFACFALSLFPALGRLQGLRVTGIVAYLVNLNLHLLIEAYRHVTL